jgi:hypothetical protein
MRLDLLKLKQFIHEESSFFSFKKKKVPAIDQNNLKKSLVIVKTATRAQKQTQ